MKPRAGGRSTSTQVVTARRSLPVPTWRHQKPGPTGKPGQSERPSERHDSVIRVPARAGRWPPSKAILRPGPGPGCHRQVDSVSDSLSHGDTDHGDSGQSRAARAAGAPTRSRRVHWVTRGDSLEPAGPPTTPRAGLGTSFKLPRSTRLCRIRPARACQPSLAGPGP